MARRRRPVLGVCPGRGDRCGEFTEPGQSHCAAHTVDTWHRAKQRRPDQASGWDRQRRNAKVMEAHSGICHICLLPGADQVDHVIPLGEGGEDVDSNLRPIHANPCHRAKTAQEAARGLDRAARMAV